MEGVDGTWQQLGVEAHNSFLHCVLKYVLEGM